MGRPSIGDERRGQILEAALDCIRRYGVAGTTLERIAEHTGMSRGHIRHFVGNRYQLMVDVAKYFYGRYTGESTDYGFPAHLTTLDELLDYLFGDAFTEPGADNALVQELVDASRANPEIAAVMMDAYTDIRHRLEAAIEREIPAAPAAARAAASYSILCLALGNVFIADLDVGIARSGIIRAGSNAILAGLRT